MIEVLWLPTGLTLQASGSKFLLYSLLEHGAAIQYQCLEGHCGACEAVLLHGEIVYDPFYAGRLPEKVHQRIYPCVCYPAKGKVTLAPVGVRMVEDGKEVQQLNSTRRGIGGKEVITHDAAKAGDH